MPNRYDLSASLDRLRSFLARAERDVDLYVAGLASAELYAEAERSVDDLQRRLEQRVHDATQGLR